jgi:hypothetical protein
MARRKNVNEKINQLIDQYLLKNIGELATRGATRFDQERRRWIVTVMCETPRGILPAGKIELDENLDLIYATPRADMARAVEGQLRRLPYLVYAEEGELQAKGIEPVTV